MKQILKSNEAFTIEREGGSVIVDLTQISSSGVSKDYVDNALSGKQDTISDLATIRSGAASGATAYQKPSGGIPSSDLANSVQTALTKINSAITAETDPTVPSWAKASSKPTYTAAEVGAISTAVTIPTSTSQLTNNSNFVSDANYVHTDNNYTTTEKNKLSGISAGAEANVQSDWNQTGTTADDYIKNKPSIPTESIVSGWGFTKNAGTITGINMNGASKGTSGVVNLGTVLTEHQSLSGCATSANYDSNAKKIYLKHDTTVLSEIDATDFIKDGMVSGASVSGSNLVITFNTDAGQEDISIPISDIFNPSNYYTKNDIDGKGYLTGYTETDPTVPAWAKASSKPTYTASEVGAISTAVTIPTSASQLTNDANYAVDANYVHTDNNYTTTEKNKLSGIASGAEVNVQSDWSQTATTADDYIKNKPTIPAEVTESTVSGWGFTKNAGTITGINMNGASKGTSGAVNLGTVVTGISENGSAATVSSGVVTLGNVVKATATGITINVLSQSAYNAIQSKDPHTLYFITGTTS